MVAVQGAAVGPHGALRVGSERLQAGAEALVVPQLLRRHLPVGEPLLLGARLLGAGTRSLVCLPLAVGHRPQDLDQRRALHVGLHLR